jgi:DNA-directed RNA polymerase specialized sigma24 family protein
MKTDPTRLSQIQTSWQEVWSAHAPEDRSAFLKAQWGLLERYGNAANRYLLGAVRDTEQAQDLAQEFAVLFLQGACQGADPAKGRFRDYLKGILRNLVRKHFRDQKRRPAAMEEPPVEPVVADEPGSDLDRAFLTCWREDLLARSWDALENLQRESAQPYHTVLKARADHPDESSDELAKILSAELGRDIKAPAYRKALQRAREKFAEFLLGELKDSLPDPSPEKIHQELIDLELYEACRPVLDRNQGLVNQ